MTLANRIVRIAISEIGVTEEPSGSNCGPRVNQYKAATNLDPQEAWYWCAAFICWVVREAMGIGECDGARYSFKRPTTAGALALETWSLKQDNSTNTKLHPRGDIQPGDLYTMKTPTGGHCGIATSKPDANGYFYGVEGNTNKAGSRNGDRVACKRRHILDLHGRIRFTV